MVNSSGGAGGTTLFGQVHVNAVRRGRAWFMWLGAVFAVLGGLAIFLPVAASLVTAIAIGLLMIVGGIFQGLHAIQNRRWGSSAWAIVSAVLYIAAGALVVAFPVTGTMTLTLVLATFFVANGALKIIRAAQHRTMAPWGWMLFDGLLSVALGALIWLHWPATGVWALGLLVGIDLIIGGLSMLFLGLGARPLAGARL
ncbi:MAG: HdeD family acid-resistance protein [Polyangiaceae bacterium]|nr:HdeD family acid-resistance protein [Polyangiaceae bacterium]